MADPVLAGRVAVITGASRGLGREMALALSGAGAQVAKVARNPGEPDMFRCDVSREEDVAALEKAILERFGRVDILINNAGVNVRKNVTDS